MNLILLIESSTETGQYKATSFVSRLIMKCKTIYIPKILMNLKILPGTLGTHNNCHKQI